MGFWDEAGWFAIGSYYAAEDGLNEYTQKKKLNDAWLIVSSLSDSVLEQEIRNDVGNASDEKFNEIWCRIEEFKRDNPHLIHKHIESSYWGYVGKERFPFTHGQFCLQSNKKKITKADEKMIATYRGWVVTLLMNICGKYSVAEATRVAFRQVYGDGRDSWTREFG
nr:MAG TPA: hypothetical protein [Caudoviricetes sp.]